MQALTWDKIIACDRLTPFGLPVVPEVHTITAGWFLPSPMSVGL